MVMPPPTKQTADLAAVIAKYQAELEVDPDDPADAGIVFACDKSELRAVIAAAASTLTHPAGETAELVEEGNRIWQGCGSGPVEDRRWIEWSEQNWPRLAAALVSLDRRAKEAEVNSEETQEKAEREIIRLETALAETRKQLEEARKMPECVKKALDYIWCRGCPDDESDCDTPGGCVEIINAIKSFYAPPAAGGREGKS